ncbi:hypothetical protein U1Q18_032453, partial [Sarracenia purpurea var. burkii]
AFFADPANKQASAPKKAHPGEDEEEDGASSGAPNHEPFSEAEALGVAVNHRLADQKKTKCCQSVRRRGIGSVHAVRSLVVRRLSAPMERTKAMRSENNANMRSRTEREPETRSRTRREQDDEPGDEVANQATRSRTRSENNASTRSRTGSENNANTRSPEVGAAAAPSRGQPGIAQRTVPRQASQVTTWDKIDMAIRLFNALKSEAQFLRLVIQDATNSLAIAYREQSEVRFCAVRWTTSLFELPHCPSRFICMLAAADSKLDIR